MQQIIVLAPSVKTSNMRDHVDYVVSCIQDVAAIISFQRGTYSKALGQNILKNVLLLKIITVRIVSDKIVTYLRRAPLS